MSSATSSETPPARDWAHYTEPSFIDADGLKTAYRRQGSGPTVVYLHGAGMTRIWLPFLQELSNSYDVVAPEHPGFGDTPRPQSLEGFDDLVLHYDALFRALELDRFHLIGHSLGGWIAANLAVFYPERFASLTLITPAGLRLVDVPSIDSFRMTPEETFAALFNGREAQYTDYLEQEGFPEDVVRAAEEGATRTLLTWNPRYDRRLDTRLARVTAPTAVIGADEDRVIPNAMVDRYAELIPGARAVRVPGGPDGPSGHVVHVEQPADVAALVAQHVNANEVAA
jgi:pimeloyl-ACP methyl ester carboxylesterase